MDIEIRLGTVTWASQILIDGKVVENGILDFDVDVSGDIPFVSLRIWPKTLIISGELSSITKVDRFGLRWHLWRGVRLAIRNIRKASAELGNVWREEGARQKAAISEALK